jgi:phosphoribosylformylglycinamidine synthase
MAKAAIRLARKLVADEMSPALHDISDGGLAVAVSELAIASGVGVTLEYADWRHLFSEDPHRFLFAVAPDSRDAVEAAAEAAGIPVTRLGTFGGDEIVFHRGGTKAVVDLATATETFRTAIPRRLA